MWQGFQKWGTYVFLQVMVASECFFPFGEVCFFRFLMQRYIGWLHELFRFLYSQLIMSSNYIFTDYVHHLYF